MPVLPFGFLVIISIVAIGAVVILGRMAVDRFIYNIVSGVVAVVLLVLWAIWLLTFFGADTSANSRAIERPPALVMEPSAGGRLLPPLQAATPAPSATPVTIVSPDPLPVQSTMDWEKIGVIIISATGLVGAISLLVSKVLDGVKEVIALLKDQTEKQQAYAVTAVAARNESLKAQPNATPITMDSPEIRSGTGDGSLDKAVEDLLYKAGEGTGS